MSDTIMTKCGEIRGTTCRWEGVRAYKGIRYATAGRWEYPVPVTRWEGIYDATAYGNCSYQPRAFYDESQVVKKAFYYNEFRKDETYTYGDDCLFLNIWTPEKAKEGSDLPVLFYIHGGGYKGGCGHEKHFDGPVWPTKDVIAVTMNYRLGMMGYLCLPELEKEAGHTGNYGLYDQIAALQWVKDNIRAFGGNPENITIMGQSAGAMSVQLLCLSPLAEGLFRKAIMSSGGGVSSLMNTSGTTEGAYEFWEMVKKEAGCNTLEDLRKAPAKDLFSAWEKVAKTGAKYGMIASPRVDGLSLPRAALAMADSGEYRNIPYMIGTNSEDIVPPIVADMAKKWCIRQAKDGRVPSYCWYFDRQLPGDENGAWHSGDLWYFFGTLENGWRPFNDHDYAISEAMATAICNFARSGDPNEKGMKLWTPTTEKNSPVMCWGEEMPHMGKPSKLKQWITLFTNKAVGE